MVFGGTPPSVHAHSQPEAMTAAHWLSCCDHQDDAADPGPAHPAVGAVTSEGLAAATQAALQSVRRTRRRRDWCPSF